MKFFKQIHLHIILIQVISIIFIIFIHQMPTYFIVHKVHSMLA